MFVTRPLRYLAGLALACGHAGMPAADTSACDYAAGDGVAILESTRQRIENREPCFGQEYRAIAARRQNLSTSKTRAGDTPGKLVGMGLSGGGIKSSAFQLGVLSGLHRARNRRGAPLLVEIDYLASVSGGSWANAAYMAAAEPDSEFFRCLDAVVAPGQVGGRCNGFARLLPSAQSEIKGSRDWQKQLVDYFLRGNDVPIADILEDGVVRGNRPFPIFMATHSNTIIGRKDIRNFPFEITPMQAGTIADCRSPETPCGFARRYLRPLHWNNAPEKGFVAGLGEENGIETVVEKYLREPVGDIYLSHAMWASGGLVAKVFSLHLRFSRQGMKIPGVREKYVLSDGGKADNLGLVPLVERGAALVILSQIASDAKLGFGDLERSTAQLKRLFGVAVDTRGLVAQYHDASGRPPFITSACIGGAGEGDSSLWMIKPTTANIAGFYDYLETSGEHADLLEFLRDEQMDADEPRRFPQNDTIRLRYPRKLVHAYYVLGRYIGERRLAPRLIRWLDAGTACGPSGG